MLAIFDISRLRTKAPSRRAYVLYLIAVPLAVLILLGAGGALIWTWDPFKRLVTASDKAFSGPEIAGGQSACFLRSIVFTKQKYDAIIVGSSKYLYVDPARFKYYRFVNGSVGAATPEFMYELLQAYARNVEVVVIALDFLMFNEVHFGYGS